MKSLKYYLIVVATALSVFVPLAFIFVGILFSNEIDSWVASLGITTETPVSSILFFVGGVLLILGLVLQTPLRNMRIALRRDVEYDEYGISKSKGDYEGLSKAERDAIDLQKTADMDRLVSAVAIKKMTYKGPANPIQELDEMIGLESVKETVREMVARMQFDVEENKRRKKKDRVPLSGRHMCFAGAPGTGKTTTARILTSFLYQYGYIKENKCIEIDGNFLKAGTDSALKTELVLRFAYGGVLFIDEAYALMDSSDNSGEQVIATLIKQMEDQRGKFVLIIAGYTEEMKQLIYQNPGFESRIKDYLFFPDYNASEMRQILQLMAKKNDFVVDESSFFEFDRLVLRERNLNSFGNARTVRNILDKAIDKHAFHYSNGKYSSAQRRVLMPEDFMGLKLGGIDENSTGFSQIRSNNLRMAERWGPGTGFSRLKK